MKLYCDLKITQKTAWFLSHCICEAFSPVEETLEGPVEADETYVTASARTCRIPRESNCPAPVAEASEKRLLSG